MKIAKIIYHELLLTLYLHYTYSLYLHYTYTILIAYTYTILIAYTYSLESRMAKTCRGSVREHTDCCHSFLPVQQVVVLAD